MDVMPIWVFTQNNSGGSFDEDMPYNAYIEAPTWYEANEIALRMGIYFEGVSMGIDCDCCGDRWSAQWERSTPSYKFRFDTFGPSWLVPYGATEWVPLIGAAKALF